MKISFWPKKNWASAIRVTLLLVSLMATILLAIAIETFRIDIKPGAFEELNRFLPYIQCFAQQVVLGQKSAKYFKDHGAAPTSLSQLAKDGLRPEDQLDPWKRPYRLRVLQGHFLATQSLGPRGQNAVDWRNPEAARYLILHRIQLVGDNLIVVTDLKRDVAPAKEPARQVAVAPESR